MSIQVTATFDLFALRFRFTALDTIQFPSGATANLLRGQLGKTLLRSSPRAYPQLFKPVGAAGEGPSGLHDPPRPFVFRANHLNGKRLTPGERYYVGVNLFDTSQAALRCFSDALAAVGRESLRSELAGVDGQDVARLPLASQSWPPRMRVHFLSPTEIKGAERPEFGVLFARIRDRVSTLRALYGAGPLEIDFRAMGERAAAIRMTRCDLQRVAAERGARKHSLSGFIGVAEYEGELGEFVPYLEIARWTGVGRQTVWGKGEIACEAF